jgi:hypothetical protein
VIDDEATDFAAQKALATAAASQNISEAASRLQAEILKVEPISLDDIFVARTAGKLLAAGVRS